MLKVLGINNSLKEKNSTESHAHSFPIPFLQNQVPSILSCLDNCQFHFFPSLALKLLKAFSFKIQLDLLFSTPYCSSWHMP